MHDLDHKDRWLPLSLLVLLLAALFLNMGIYPLYLEEPRRALIALEMLYNDNLWVPTEFGAFYYKKPPVFNWVIIAGYKLFGSYSEVAVRFFSVVSYLAMGLLVFVFGKRHVGFSFGIYAAFFFFLCSDLLFYFTVIGGEIDIFYALVTYTSFLTIYHFYRKKQFYWLFATTYLLGAVGTLTKGLPSVAFLGISLLAWFVYKKDFKKLLALPHFAGMALYLAVVGGYVFIYSQYNDPMLFLTADDSVLTQTTDRTLFTNGMLTFLRHVALFPLELIKIMAPGSLFAVFLLGKKTWPRLFANEYIAFCLVIFAANISIYWISPGTASRYLYMLFPPAVCVLVYAALHHGAADWRSKAVSLFFGFVILVLLAGCIALPWIEQLSFIEYIVPLSVGASLVFAALGVAYFRLPKYRTAIFVAGMLAGRIVFDLTVLPVRAYKSNMYEHKRQGEQVAEIAKGLPIFLHKGAYVSRTSIFYMEKLTGGIVRLTDSFEQEGYYLLKAETIGSDGAAFESVFQFRQGRQEFHLAKRLK